MAKKRISSPRHTKLAFGFNLTKQEWRVIRLVALGYSNKRISEILVIGRKTVENYINTIYHKFLPYIRNGENVHTRVFIANYYNKYFNQLYTIDDRFEEISNQLVEFKQIISHKIIETMLDEEKNNEFS
jgi:hypothetical protein